MQSGFFRILSLGVLVLTAACGGACADDPVSKTEIKIDGFWEGRPQERITQFVEMLKKADQEIVELSIHQDGRGKILGATVTHKPSFWVNQDVQDAATALRVTSCGLVLADSICRISAQIDMLKAANEKIVNVEIMGYGFQGRVTQANIWHVSMQKYEGLRPRLIESHSAALPAAASVPSVPLQ